MTEAKQEELLRYAELTHVLELTYESGLYNQTCRQLPAQPGFLVVMKLAS